jgi:hypothetical protein
MNDLYHSLGARLRISLHRIPEERGFKMDIRETESSNGGMAKFQETELA